MTEDQYHELRVRQSPICCRQLRGPFGPSLKLRLDDLCQSGVNYFHAKWFWMCKRSPFWVGQWEWPAWWLNNNLPSTRETEAAIGKQAAVFRTLCWTVEKTRFRLSLASLSHTHTHMHITKRDRGCNTLSCGHCLNVCISLNYKVSPV